MMYNFPSVTSGIDMDSDLIIDIAKAAPNICGVKLTCAAVGKLTRIAAVTNDPSFRTEYPRKVDTAPFLVIDGFIDFLLPSMAAGSSGAITGLANFAPVRLQYCSAASPLRKIYTDGNIENVCEAMGPLSGYTRNRVVQGSTEDTEFDCQCRWSGYQDWNCRNENVARPDVWVWEASEETIDVYGKRKGGYDYGKQGYEGSDGF
jgi:hypothetical protein